MEIRRLPALAQNEVRSSSTYPVRAWAHAKPLQKYCRWNSLQRKKKYKIAVSSQKVWSRDIVNCLSSIKGSSSHYLVFSFIFHFSFIRKIAFATTITSVYFVSLHFQDNLTGVL